MADARARTTLTYDDYLLMPDDGNRHEIIDGEHVVNAAPNLRHQRVAGRLFVELVHRIEGAALGEVLIAPVALALSTIDIVEPDILVVLKGSAARLQETRVEGPPDLVIEVLSPSTATRDRRRKLKLYEAASVPEYWIVDPDRCLLHQHVLEGGSYRLIGSHGTTATAATIPAVVIDLERIFRVE